MTPDAPDAPARATCRYCRRRLRDWSGLGWGYGGDGEFCTLRCGYRWALQQIRKDDQ